MNVSGDNGSEGAEGRDNITESENPKIREDRFTAVAKAIVIGLGCIIGGLGLFALNQILFPEASFKQFLLVSAFSIVIVAILVERIAKWRKSR